MPTKCITIPKHVAIIMDGNGRWAKRQGKPRLIGHRAGAKNIAKIVDIATKNGVDILTLWAFSTENWGRPKEEVKYLMKLSIEMAKTQLKTLKKNNIQLRIIGDTTKFSAEQQKYIQKAEETTRDNTGLKLILAANYGGKWDILQATCQIAEQVKQGVLQPENIDEKTFSGYLMLSDLPDPDLLIRTGGELRISNFFLWQLAYTELYFTDVFWPEFDEKAFRKALQSYAKRNRRFGKVE